MPAYKSFCWALGTTSFRTAHFNKTIEQQLSLLNEFWQLNENQNEIWEANNALQSRYYDFMKEKGIKFTVRGLRDVDDYKYETTMARYNEDMYGEVTTLFIPTPAKRCATQIRILWILQTTTKK